MSSPTIHETMGVTLIGVFFAAFFLGISVLQTLYYFIHYDKDGKWMHALVLAVITCDIVHQSLICHTVYTYLVSHYGEPTFLSTCVQTLLAEVLFNGFTALLVQCFLTHRVWSLGKSKIITGLAASLVFAEFACVFAFGVIGLVRIRTFDDLKKLENLSITVNALAAAGDVVLAMALTWLLLRSRTGFRKSDTMIRKLIIFAINTGLLTTLTAIASLISILARPNTFIYICFFFNIGRFYTNSLLATLNVRQAIRNAGDACGGVNTTGQMDFSMKMSVLKNDTSFGSINGQRRQDISIKVDTTKELITDASIRAPSSTKSAADCDGIFSDEQSGFDSSEDIDTRGYGHGRKVLKAGEAV